MSKKNTEKRKLHRLSLNLEALCCSEGAFFKAYVQDISSGGLKLETQKRLEQDQLLSMSITAHKPIKLSGRVKWRTAEKLHFLYGIQFDDLTEDIEASLRELVQGLFWKNYGG